MSAYALGTRIDTRGAWGFMVGGRAMCADGKVRALSYIAGTADTYFSVRASIRIKGKTVDGYVTTAETEEGESYVQFRKHTNGKNAAQLPDWPLAGR